MSFLDKFKSSATAASQAATVAAGRASTTAKSAAAIARLKVSIVSEEDKLKKAYTELGRLFLRDMDAQVEADLVEYNPWCEKAHDALDAIARLTEEMDAMKAQLRAPAGTATVVSEATTADNAEATVATAPIEVAAPADNTVAAEETVPAEEPVESVPEAVEDAPAAEEEDTSIFAD